MKKQTAAPAGLPGIGLTVWVIYREPLDFPGWCVLRPQEVAMANGYSGIARGYVACLAKTVEELRAPLKAHGLHWMPRQPGDFGAIVETWF